MNPPTTGLPGFWGPKIKKFNPQTKIFLLVLNKNCQRLIYEIYRVRPNICDQLGI